MSGSERFTCDHCGKDRMSFFLMDCSELLDDPRADQVNICMACYGLPYLPAYWRGWLDSFLGNPFDHNDHFL